MGLRSNALLFLSAGLCWQASAQTFNARFDLFDQGGSQTGWGVEILPNDDALVIFSGGYTLEGLYYSSGVSSVVVGPNGDFSDGFRFHVPARANYTGWANCFSPRQDGGYFMGGATALAGDSGRVALYWIEESGQVSNFRELDLPGRYWAGRSGKQTLDGGYITVGEMTNDATNDQDAFAVKTDAIGNVEWVRTYGGATREAFASVEPAPWGGYYLGGQQQIAGDVWKTWIVRVDAQGELLGEATYGSYPFGSGGAQLTLAPDGTVWVGSSERHAASVYQRRACIFQIGTDGQVLWHREYGRFTRTALFSVLPIPSSTDLIAVGTDDNTSQAGGLQGLLLRVNADGDSLWLRTYKYYDAQVGQRNASFYDMQPTPDGGFIAVGLALSVPGQYSQDVWVVKTDSMGCIEPGCHLITGVESQIANLKDVLRVWPNPVAQGGMVQVSLELPPNFDVQGHLRLSVVSSDGRLVQEQHVPAISSETSFVLPLNSSAGMYHLHLSDDSQWLGGAKVVVE